MAKDGRLIYACAGALGLAGLLVCSPSLGADKQDNAVTASLAVQTALQQGRESLVRGDAKAAVYVLESQLSRINGNGTYLSLLRDAYRAHVKQLRLANQDDEAQIYLKRLQILDPGASLDGTITQRSNPPPPPPSSEKSAGRPEPKVVRGSMAEEDPQARLTRTSKSLQARGLVAQAEEEFRKHRYQEAWLLFEQAHETDPDTLSACRERWAYCKLRHVFDEVKQPAAGQPAWTKLEREARLAMNLAPRLEQYGNVVLAEIEKQRGSRTAEDAGIRDVRSGVSVQHFERGAERWARTETANFRIFHNQSREMAEQVARVAETTRTAMYRKWFGNAEPEWNPKCDLYLHATARDYGQATGVLGNSPGHSSFQTDHGRILMRRVDLHCEARNLLTGVLPHETTHVVLAAQFVDQPIPRWADEGMAVLSEPRELVERHLGNLSSSKQNGQTLRLSQLVQLNDYPEPRFISGFYAQSVSLVEYLSSLRGPQEFSQFLRDAQREGHEASLNRHFGIRGFTDLEQRWSQYASRGRATDTGLAAKQP